MKQNTMIWALLVLMTACGGNNEGNKEAEDEDVAEVTNVILSDAQVKKLEMEFGPLPMHDFAGEVEANGKLAIAPQSQASVSPVVGGNIQKILVHEGQKVTKGQVLATLSHPDILDVQSRYLDAHNRLLYVEAEYGRQKKLYDNQVGSGREYQQVTSEYRQLQGQLRTTAAQLRMMGISPERVAEGETVTAIALQAPISGTVERINAHTGQYTDNQQEVFHIVNFDDIYADLLVFEKDLPRIHAGQAVNFELKSSCGDKFTGKITSIGRIFDNTPKATHVRATIEGPEHEFTEGLYLCGKIATDSQQAPALNTEGVVDFAGKTYAFTASHADGKWTFQPVEVIRLREEKGFVEIELVNTPPADVQFALSGAYYLLSEMKKAETGEED